MCKTHTDASQGKEAGEGEEERMKDPRTPGVWYLLSFHHKVRVVRRER